jgi:hypothetical protein
MLTGQVALENNSDQKLKVRAIPTREEAERTPLAQRGLAAALLAARLAPGERARVPAHFLVDSSTPPGTYETTLRCGDQEEQAVLHVFRNDVARVEPSPLQLSARAGETVSQAVVVSNRGNVPQYVPEAKRVFIEERAWGGRAAVFALREASAAEGHQEFLDRLLQEFRASLVDPVEVRVGAEISELAPGETAQLGLEIKLPRELVKHRVYYGSTRFAGGSLSLRVVCLNDAPPRRRQATRRRTEDE